MNQYNYHQEFNCSFIHCPKDVTLCELFLCHQSDKFEEDSTLFSVSSERL